MRILFLTNFYPPHEIGGQGRSCQEVFEGLSARGHVCLVLTSMHEVGDIPTEEPGVRRWLHLEMDMIPMRHWMTFFTQRKQREQKSLEALEKTIADFQPDVIFIWGMWNLPRSLPVLAERLLPDRVSYRFAEYWPTLPSQHEMYWRAPERNWKTRLPKRVMRSLALFMLGKEQRPAAIQFKHAVCVSAGTRQELVDAGVPVSHARVIHTGIEIGEFTNGRQPAPKTEGGTLTLLYAGRFSAEKGIATILEALGELAQSGQTHYRLKLAGSGKDAYEDELARQVRQLGLDGAVTFLGRVPAHEMNALMRSCEVLIVPSIWPEPFARVVLEGMGNRMVVVATSTGGTGEIIRDGSNGLLFPPGDGRALAGIIRSLGENPELRRKLAESGWETVTTQFTKSGMLDAYENFLAEAAGCRPQGAAL